MEKFHEIGLFFSEYGDDYLEPLDGLKVRGFPVVHAPVSIPHGIRIENGSKTFGFSGDTEWTDSLKDISENADLFICECNNFETEVSGHLTHSTLKERSGDFACKRMLLNHLGEEMYDNIDNVEFELTQEGQTIEF